MFHHPRSRDSSSQQSRAIWLRLFSQPVLGALLVLGVLLSAAAWRGLIFVEQELAPLIQKNLQQILQRPVVLGPLRRYSLTELEFGRSQIPTYTTTRQGQTVQDRDEAVAESVVVRFNPWLVLFQQTLPLDVTLNRPQIYLDESPNGRWLATTITPLPPGGWLKIRLNSLKVADAKVTLAPERGPVRKLAETNTTLVFPEQEDPIRFHGTTAIDSGGRAAFNGTWKASESQLLLTARTQALALVPLLPFLPPSPIQVQSGQFDGRIDVQYRPQQPLRLVSQGTVTNVAGQWPAQRIAAKVQRVNLDLAIALPANQQPIMSGKATLQNATGQVPEQLVLANGRNRLQTARNVSGTLAFLGASQQMTVDLKGTLAAGGQAKVKGDVLLPLRAAKLAIQAQDVPAALFDRAYQLPIRIGTGRVDGNVVVQLRQNQRPALLGTALLKQVNAAVPAIPQPFLGTNGYLRFRGLTVALDRITSRYGPIPLKAQGTIDPDRGYDLTAETAAVDANTALTTLKVGALPFPVAGQVQAVNLRVNGAIDEPVLTGQAQTVGRATIDRVPLKDAVAQFKFVPGLLSVTAITAYPANGGLITGQARLQLPTATETESVYLQAQFQGSGLSGDAIAKLYQANPGFAIGLVSGTAVVSGPPDDIRTAVRFEAPQGTYPTVGNALVNQGKTFLQNVVAQIKGGPLRLDGVVADGRVNVNATLPGLTLADYSPELRGTLSGRLAVTGPLAGFGAKTARAQGSVKFSQGLSVLQDPLNAQIRWDGQQILVDRATAPDFVAQGRVGAELEGPQGPSLTTLDLRVLARNYDINRLAAPGLTQNPLYGLANLNGRLTGTVSAPVLTSQLEVDRFRVSDLEFEPFLVGTFNYNTTQGLALNLGGTRDRIQVALDAQQQPISLDIRRDQSTIIGRRTTPDRFDATFTDVPLLALNSFPQLIPPQLTPNLKPVSGVASGTIALNLPTWETAGSFTVERPGLGRFIGDRFTGQIRYANGVGTLSEGRLVQGNNQYQLDATLSNFANPQVTGRLLIAQAQVEDLIAVAKSLQLSLGPNAADGTVQGRAQDVATVPVNMQQVPLWQQLQRLSEVDALLEQVKERQGGSDRIPDWQKLTGTLAGAIQFSGSLQAGVSATFDLQGQNWDLDPYRFDQFIAKGNLSPSGINFEPLTLRYGTSAASFNGRIGGPQQSGQLVLNQFPVETIADLLELPVNLTGQLNGTATLAGRWDNPSVQGAFSLDQGTLNRATIQQANLEFDYQSARLAFGGVANIGSPDPIRISGSVPYALPFSAVQPNNQQVDIAMSVKDQGLSLVNLFTDQVSWVDGKGDLTLQVNGTADKPLLNGSLTLQNATLRSPTLADPLTAVNGTVRFDSDRIMVKSLTGRYNQGELSAEGNLPIFNDALRVKEPLVVSLNNTALNVKGLYRGQANGNLSVTGSATNPNLSGFIALQNGEVLLAEATALESASTVPATADSGNMSVDFQDLQVRLGENVRILQPPILSFVASGQVDVDGSLNAPRPNGIVKFEKGNVYLFTTVFRVDQRQDNYAQFTPAYGLDPYLNLSLRTTVTEVAAGRKTNLNEFADIQAGSLGSIESVRVRATLRGRASQLSTRFNDVLELSSTPSRTPTEILALLSGGVSQSLASGDTQGALVNLAGSAFFNRVQSVVDDVLGSRATFRLFPLLTPTEDKSSTVLELGAEFGYDVTDRLSLSLLQVVTSPNELPQFNVSYDITDQLRARGSVNFQGDAVGILEYRLRF